jgi:polar amino acid transport system substrate-binding protein
VYVPACVATAALVVISAATGAGAQPRDESPAGSQPRIVAPPEEVARELLVATKEAPPFAFRGPDGEWTGIAIDLFAELADEMDLSYRLEEATLQGMIDGVSDGRYDAAVGALTITEPREERVDFTYPFYSTGLGIAVDKTSASGWTRVARNFITWQFVSVVAGLVAVLLAAGTAVWIFERRRNSEEFDREPGRGLGDGFWWAAVTMTTVGYGDKSPVTLGGRIVGTIWMYASMIIVAGFTASITASLTVGQINGAVQTISDLARMRVGVVASSAAVDELAELQISTRSFDTIDMGMQALLDDRIDAFVQDRPLLRYAVRHSYQGRIDVLPNEVGRQDYGIALAQGSDLREPLNRALLVTIRSPRWRDLVGRYLGREE